MQQSPATYPAILRDAHDDPEADPVKVASWFSRNAKTGERASINQAKLYLLILSGKLPDPDEATTKTRVPRPAAKKAAPRQVTRDDDGKGADSKTITAPDSGNAGNGGNCGSGPTLHVDLQIHISADAGDAQIDSIFKSMAKHLYGKK